MQFATLLLLFPFTVRSLSLLPILLGYGILLFCIKKLSETVSHKRWVIVGVCNVILCFVAYGIPLGHTVMAWILTVLSMTLDLVLFYGLTTIIYHETGNTVLLAKQKKLLVFSAVSVVAYCLWLNVSYFLVLVWLGRWMSRLYFISSICPQLYQTQTDKKDLKKI